MSNLIVVVFDDAEQAGQVRESLKSVEHEGKMSLDDSAVVVKDENGKIHVKNQVDRGVKIGAVSGGLIGILLASVFFPVGGLIIGAVAGGLIGKSAGLGISKSFVKEVSDVDDRKQFRAVRNRARCGSGFCRCRFTSLPRQDPANNPGPGG